MEDGEIGTSRKPRFRQAGIAPHKRVVNAIQNGFRGFAAYNELRGDFARAMDIGNAVAVSAICHHEMEIDIDPKSRVDRGIDVLIDYFTGDWLNSFEEMEGHRMRENNPHALPESWMNVFVDGLVLCAITSRHDALVLCSEAIGHIRITGKTPPCYGFRAADVASLLLIANEFSRRKKATLKDCNDTVSQSRLSRPKKIATALRGIADLDEDLFGDAFHWLMDEYIVERSWKSSDPRIWIARIESFLYQHAQYRGMAPPKLTEKEAKFIVTEQTAFAQSEHM